MASRLAGSCRSIGLNGTVALAAVMWAGVIVAQNQANYRTPPAEAAKILNIPLAPKASISADGRWVVITQLTGLPSVELRAAPMIRLGGVRMNARTNGPYDAGAYDDHSSYTGRGASFTLVHIANGAERKLNVPTDGLGPPMWSPDSAHFAFLRTTRDGIEAWVTDVDTGESRAVTGPEINAARSIDMQSDAPCSWLSDSARLLCHFVPKTRGTVPREDVPTGVLAQQTTGAPVPIWTFTNLLTRPLDESLYDYYMASQPMSVNIKTAQRTPVAPIAVYQTLQPAQGSSYFLAVRIVRPYSYSVPANRFPKVVEILDGKGKVMRTVASLPMDATGPAHLGWAADGPRGFAWRPGLPASLVFVEALDKGNPKVEAEYRDRLLRLDAPFDKKPLELLRTKSRIVTSDGYMASGVMFSEGGKLALVREFDWGIRRARTWQLQGQSAKSSPLLVWDYTTDDWYNDPGSVLVKPGQYGEPVIQANGDWIYLTGQGGSPKGDYPFVDRFNIKTRVSQRLFRSAGERYENVIAVLDADGTQLLTSYESSTEPPNFYFRDLKRDTRKALTSFSIEKNALSQASRQQINYTRNDGVQLSGKLYLPAGYKQGERLPAIVWAYPLEYASKSGAGQVRGSSYRFSGVSPTSMTDYFLFLTRGYAVLADASMPIVGGLEANDTYVEQLVANGQAAVDKLVDTGIVDRHRVGVAGISYGAFMTANLLANSDVFASGVAINGAYNRTLTPFGFQRERRTYWEAPQIYNRMSAFMQADELNEPILLLVSEIDSNSGTFPIQSMRLYHALQGLGRQARMVTLPYEDHLIVAKENRLHAVAEMFDWFDRYVKNATPSSSAH